MVVTYSLVYFGAPLRFALPGLGPVEASLWCGAAVGSLSLYTIAHCLRHRADLDRSTLFALAIVLFIGATGILTAMGRSHFNVSNMWSGRYGFMVVQLVSRIADDHGPFDALEPDQMVSGGHRHCDDRLRREHATALFSRFDRLVGQHTKRSP